MAVTKTNFTEKLAFFRGSLQRLPASRGVSESKNRTPFQYFVWFLEIIFAALLLYVLALLFWDFTSPRLPVVEGGGVAVTKQTKNRAATDWSVFASVNPFYRDQKIEAVEETALTEARETNLDLELFGIRYSPDGSGVAIIRTPDKQQGAFRAGDEIFDGVILNRVLEDRVAIERSGVLEVLTFPGQQGTGQVAADGTPRNQAGQQQ
ncbi:type II secretion system protein N [Emcibacter nanhaiensis]|uniref:type II secretion system protein N n=1 Tax=Emcibacter nanhaiensis TaxID=1505037 RepID=UPI0015E2C97E|nr:type II secretion system protein N [Emcibacter nanhaiensis]